MSRSVSINHTDLPDCFEGYWVIIQRYKTSTKRKVRNYSGPNLMLPGQTKGSLFICLKAEVTVEEYNRIQVGDFFDGSTKVVYSTHILQKLADKYPLIDVEGYSYKCMPATNGKVALELI